MKSERILTDDEIKALEKELGRTFEKDKIFSSQKKIEEYINDNSFSFIDCLFNCKVNFINRDIQQLDMLRSNFSNSVFAGDVDFSNSNFIFGAYFKEAIFLQKAIFKKAIFNSKSSSIKIYKRDSSFESVVFKGEVDFSNCNFSNCNFISFKSTIFQNTTDFSSTLFKKVCFNNTSFYKDVKFEKVIFKGEADFQCTEKSVGTIKNIPNISLNNATFESKAIFYHRHFNEILLENTRFEKLSDFYKTVFHEDISFYKTDFVGTSVFSKAEFENKAVFHYSTISNNMILRDAHFKNGINLACINLIGDGYLNTFSVIIDDFDTTVYYSDIDEDWKIISCKHKRETYRMFKHEALMQNNRIEALNFHAKEMEAYRQELRAFKKISKNQTIDKENKNEQIEYSSWDRFILSINRLSNKYGLSPGIGLGWLLVVSLVFFAWYWYSLEIRPVRLSLDAGFKETKEALGLVSSQYFQFTNPTHSINFMKEFKGDWSIFIDLFSRIFIGFLIYQIIQAFRKYRRF